MRYLIFLFIPICVYFAIVPLREAWGHYYYAINSDPSYLYLFNGLNIATLQPSAHVDNPGTTTQLFSALAIKISAMINGTDDIQKDIILHPEQYIIIINRSLFIVCLTVLFLFGVFSFKFTDRLWYSLFLQTVPFYSWQLMRIFLKVSPEMMIFIACLLWVLTLIRLSSNNDLKENNLKYTIWFAFLTAFSLATKLTMIPFLLIPLILMPPRISVNYLLLSFILFHLFIFPTWAHYDYLISWIGRLFRHASLYGSGAPTIIDFPQAIFSFTKLIALEHPLYFATLFATVLLAMVYKSSILRNALRHSIDIKILFSLVLVVLVQLLLVAKHFNPHYLIPSLMLFPAIINFSSNIYSNIVSLESERLQWTKNISAKSGIFLLILISLIVRHAAKHLPDHSILEWISNTVFLNVLWLFIVLAVFFGISILLKRHQKARRGFLNISIYTIAVIYVMRHADLAGFRNRLKIEANESEVVINTINERYSDYTIIYGERSSSIPYALKYGANENFPQPNHFIMMKDVYGKKSYFWDHSVVFKTWTEEVALRDILKENDKVLLECDKRFTSKEKLQVLQQEEEIALEKVYSGISGELYLIKKRVEN